uniref:D-aspartate oxidase n=1 Tax=Dromaius novaehollandiae TaxID=8790 RepID=A0A8C4P7F9_DRONO
MAAPKVAVVGAGVVGLSTALCVTEAFPACSLAVIADRFTPNTTSDVAAGMLIPHTIPALPWKSYRSGLTLSWDFDQCLKPNSRNSHSTDVVRPLQH